MDWWMLTKERDEWIAHNFPDNKLPRPQESILGVVEEIGELAHSHLKELQNIRGTEAEHQLNAKDAIGDITIYLLGVLSHHQITPTPEQALGPNVLARIHENAQNCIYEAARWAGFLHHVSTPRAVEIRTGNIVAALHHYCIHRGWNYEQIVTDTWLKVKQRDWTADPSAGGE